MKKTTVTEREYEKLLTNGQRNLLLDRDRTRKPAPQNTRSARSRRRIPTLEAFKNYRSADKAGTHPGTDADWRPLRSTVREYCAVLIGTWNFAGRWSPAHRVLLEQQACDVWLLTEVSDSLALPGFLAYRSAAEMAPRRRWSAVLTREPARQLPDPHPASAAVTIGGTTFCSTVLPWRSCGQATPWVGGTHAAKTAAAVITLDAALPSGPLVWGGDWNHAMEGREYAGSLGGRTAIVEMVQRRGLQVPTSMLPHRIDGLVSIDHVAVDRHAHVGHAERFAATGLSDHDGYVIDAV